MRLCFPLHQKIPQTKGHERDIMLNALLGAVSHSHTLLFLQLLQEQVSRPIAHRPCPVYVVQTEEVVVISR